MKLKMRLKKHPKLLKFNGRYYTIIPKKGIVEIDNEMVLNVSVGKVTDDAFWCDLPDINDNDVKKLCSTIIIPADAIDSIDKLEYAKEKITRLIRFAMYIDRKLPNLTINNWESMSHCTCDIIATVLDADQPFHEIDHGFMLKYMYPAISKIYFILLQLHVRQEQPEVEYALITYLNELDIFVRNMCSIIHGDTGDTTEP